MPRVTSNSPSHNAVLNSDGRLIVGVKHHGKLLDTVVRDDPDYLRYALRNYDIDDDDRRVIEAALKYAR